MDLRLYPKLPMAEIERIDGLDVDRDCRRCELHKKARTVCMPADGVSGGLLIIGDHPDKRCEDAQGRVFIGDSGSYVRKLLGQWWKGPVAFDNAIRCAPGAEEIGVKMIEACRPYLAQTLREVQPKRIITLGGPAALSVMGRSIAPYTNRKSYGYFYDPDSTHDGFPIPVFFVIHPAAALRNRFVREWFEDDLKWALTCDPPAQPPVEAQYRLVDSTDVARTALAELRAARWAAFDVESAGPLFDPRYRMLCASFCPHGSESPWMFGSEALGDPTMRQLLKDYLADDRASKGGQNVKFDMLAMRCALDVEVRGVIFDTRLKRKLLDAEASAALNVMAEQVGMGGMKEEASVVKAEVLSKLRKGLSAERRIARYQRYAANPRAHVGKAPPKPGPAVHTSVTFLQTIDPSLLSFIRTEEETERFVYALLPTEVLYRYNARDSTATARLETMLEAQLDQQPDLERVWTKVVKNASNALEQVEAWGVAVDMAAITTFDQYLDTNIAEVRKRLDTYGTDFNPDSPPQVAELLFKKLKLKPSKKTKKEADSTDKGSLELLKLAHPIVPAILDWRKFRKLKGTYAAGMIPHIRPDGRIHPNIKLDGARSGRTSCVDPNLQNIPRAKDSPEGKMIRDCFIAPPGSLLLEADYSQLELRVAAMLSGDPEMLAIFEEGVDYHQRTAELVCEIAWGIKASQVESKHRSEAKTINFGLLYGMGDDALAAKMSASSGMQVLKSQAARVREAILGKFRVLASWIQARLSEARKTGVARTWWDGLPARIRPLYRIADVDDVARSVAEHSSWNTPIQGTASEFCVASLDGVVEWIIGDAVPAKLVLAVHDSLMLEVKADCVEEVAHQVRHIMTGHASNGVPLDVDLKVGPSWGSLTKLAA